MFYIIHLSFDSLFWHNREIGDTDRQDISVDTSGTKSYAAFLAELAQSLPHQMAPSVQFILPHLEGEVSPVMYSE